MVSALRMHIGTSYSSDMCAICASLGKCRRSGIGVWLVEEEVKGVSELLTRFMRSYPLFEINEHGVEDVGDL